MNVQQVMDVIRDIDSRNIDDLMLAKATLQTLDRGYQEAGINPAEWVVDGINALTREITNKNRAELQRQLKVKMARRGDLATAREKREVLDIDIKALEEKLSDA